MPRGESPELALPYPSARARVTRGPVFMPREASRRSSSAARTPAERGSRNCAGVALRCAPHALTNANAHGDLRSRVRARFSTLRSALSRCVGCYIEPAKIQPASSCWATGMKVTILTEGEALSVVALGTTFLKFLEWAQAETQSAAATGSLREAFRRA